MLTVSASPWATNTTSKDSPVRSFETNSIRSPYECIFKTALQWFDAAGTHEKYESGRDLDSLAALYVSLLTYIFCVISYSSFFLV